MTEDQIQKEWESYLRDRTVSIEYFNWATSGKFSTAQPLGVTLTPIVPVQQQVAKK